MQPIIRIHPAHDTNACDWCRTTRQLRRIALFNRIFRRTVLLGVIGGLAYGIIRVVFG